MTISETQRVIADQLRTCSDAPELDAQRIILHAIHKHDTSYLLGHPEEILTEDQQKSITNMVEKRVTGVPLAYILGRADFYGRTFIATPDVLIPRPDTEVLIEKTLEYIKSNFSRKQEIVIADLCTGSGCIAITLALELPRAHIIATDISPAALEVAKQNEKTHNVIDRIEFYEGDLVEPLKNKKIDLLVSNPPYVPAEALATAGHSFETRGLLFEPAIALDGGEDGLKFVNQIQHYAQEKNIPAIVETVGGEIVTMNI